MQLHEPTERKAAPDTDASVANPLDEIMVESQGTQILAAQYESDDPAYIGIQMWEHASDMMIRTRK